MCHTSTAVGLSISLPGKSTEESGSHHARSGASLLQPVSWWTLGRFRRSLLEDARVLKRIVQMSCCTHVSQTAASDGETRCVIVGECVLLNDPVSHTRHRAQKNRMRKADHLWTVIVWLGKSCLSDEHLMDTAFRTRTCRTIRRRVVPRRWDNCAATTMGGPPWGTKFEIGLRVPGHLPQPPVLALVPADLLWNTTKTNRMMRVLSRRQLQNLELRR